MLEQYRKHVEERAAEGVVPKPLDAEQMAALVELIKQPPAGEEEFILNLLANRVPAGVDEAAYIKAGFLSAIANGEVSSPILTAADATELLGTMLGGYNIAPLINLLDNPALAPIAVKDCPIPYWFLMRFMISRKKQMQVMRLPDKLFNHGPMRNGLPTNSPCLKN